MKATRANVEEYAVPKGYTPIQKDGIPEGFAWREPDITIADIVHTGRIVTFEPLKEFAPKYE